MTRIALVAVLAGCMHAQPLPARTDGEGVVYVASVPFYGGPGDHCGPAVLASILGYYGITRAPAAIANELPRGPGGGALALDIALYPRRFGLATSFGRGDLEGLEAHLSAGHPVIVMLERDGRLHYQLVVGYDAPRRQLLLYTDDKSNVAMPVKAFLEAWSQAGEWMAVVVPRTHRLHALPIEHAALSQPRSGA